MAFLTFGLTWGTAALGLLFVDQVTAIFGEFGLSNPLVILAIYSPGIVGVLLVAVALRVEGPGQLLSPPDAVADAGSMVAVPYPGHPGDLLC